MALDRVQAFGTTFLGLTVHCAQCHDHKYDPITQQEYFQFYAFLNNFSGEPETTKAPDRGLQPPFIYLTTPEEQSILDEFDAEKTRLSDFRDRVREQIAAAGTWPQALERASVPWIWSEAATEGDTVEFRAVLELDGAAERSIVRFTAMSTAEVEINGTLLGRSVSFGGGISADVSELLLRGENLIMATATGAAGFALILDYEVDGEARTFTTSADWLARQSGEEQWHAAREIRAPEYVNGWMEMTAPSNLARLSGHIDAVDARRREFASTIPAAMVMRERDPPRPASVLIGGMYDAPGAPVERNTPAILPPMKDKDGAYSRMDLADWLVDPGHPLTARVAVNRFWQQFFGVGLVKTSEDFGAQGEWPSHPELLDDLAVEFVESGWNVKELVRSIVLSNTYRQRSDAAPEEYARDPENRELARGSRYRMDAEMIRDQILAVSGLLNRAMYGRSVKPPQPPGLWEMVSMAEPLTYVADTGESIYRRSLYTYWRRGMPPPQMTIMNAPSREYCVARRERTNTPLQALLLMNEQEYFTAAKACVQSTLHDSMDVGEGVRLLYEKITSHEPEPDRVELMKETLRGLRKLYARDPALTEEVTPELAGAPFDDRVELASWTLLTHGLLNLELTKVRR